LNVLFVIDPLMFGFRTAWARGLFWGLSLIAIWRWVPHQRCAVRIFPLAGKERTLARVDAAFTGASDLCRRVSDRGRPIRPSATAVWQRIERGYAWPQSARGAA
jgi:hypothetical protein